MAIPNTTQTPNIIFDKLMAKMTDTELRVVMAVVRATLGWEQNKKTGMRKQEDWLSYWQLKEITGRGYTALSQAIESCIQKNWIEARDEKGNILDTKNKRIGKKIFYRLGSEILDKIETSSERYYEKEEEFVENRVRYKLDTKERSPESGDVKPTSSESEITESEITESEAYKRNTLQKKPITKIRLDKPTRRKEISFSKSDYELVLQEYQALKGIKLNGKEFDPVMQDIKTMFMSQRKPEEIIKFMRWMAEKAKDEDKKWDWTRNWTIKTIRLKLPEFLAGKLERSADEDIIIPDYAKQWHFKKQ